MASILYEIRDLRFRYLLGHQVVEALRGVSLTVEKGAVLVLSGPSGSGKTTLLNVLGLIEPVQDGRVAFEGRELKAMSETEKNHLRRYQLGFIFQQFHLMPVLTAEENVEFFLSRQGVPARERAERVKDALEAVGLWEHRQKKPLEMSGGQRQRVAIARAVAKRPHVIIADEPTASLDQATGRGIMDLLAGLHAKRDVTLVIASHDQMVHSYAKQHVTLQDGQILKVA